MSIIDIFLIKRSKNKERGKPMAETNTILYKNTGSSSELNNTQQLDRKQDFTKRISTDEAPEDPLSEEFAEGLDSSDTDADTKINQSNYLRYLSELRKSDSELALAKAESAELVRLMDSYREHYAQYEELVKNQVQENSAVVDEKLKSIKALARRIRKTSDSLDSRINEEVLRLTEALSKSIEGSIRQSCDDELKKLSEATHILHDYSDQVKEQYEKLQRLEGIKLALFAISSLCSPIILVLLILNLLHII